jgi:hypothetical protein
VTRLVPVLVFLLAVLAPPAPAQAGPTRFAAPARSGFGLGGGSLTSGVHGKHYLTDTLAVQATLGVFPGWGLGGNVDGVLEMPQLWSADLASVNWYVGAGVNVAVGAGLLLGASPIAGLSLQLHLAPIDVAFELRPTLQLSPALGFSALGTGGAVRYWF